MFLFCQCDKRNHHEDANSIPIGVLLPYSGNLSDYGISHRKAMELAVYEINKSGGIYGKDISLLVKDTETNDDVAVEKANELISLDAIALIGISQLTANIAVAEKVAIPNKILLIATNQANQNLSVLGTDNPNDYTYNLLFTEEFLAKRSANYLSGIFPSSIVGIIYQDNELGNSIADPFAFYMEEYGMQCIKAPYPELNEKESEEYNFSPIISAMMESKPNLIYMITYEEDGVRISYELNKYISSDNPLSFLGYETNKTEKFFAGASSQVTNGMYFTGYFEQIGQQNYDKFKTAYIERYDESPTASSELAYDAVYLTAYSLMSLGNFDPDTLTSKVSRQMSNKINAITQGTNVVNVNEFASGVSYLQKGETINYHGASGDISFDNRGNAIYPALGFVQYKNGSLVLVQKFN